MKQPSYYALLFMIESAEMDSILKEQIKEGLEELRKERNKLQKKCKAQAILIDSLMED